MIFLAIAAGAVVQQFEIPRVDLLPDQPAPYVMRDWSKTIRDYDRAVFNPDSKGPYLPLIWRVPNAPNLQGPGYGVPSYVGSEDLRGKAGESIAGMGSLLGPSIAGIDKRSWVELTPEYLNPQEGTVLNNAGGHAGSSFWYDLLPSVVFCQLSTLYPSWDRGTAISKGVADAWMGATNALNADFDHTAYNFETKKPSDNHEWKEPDSAAAVSYIELLQYSRSRDRSYLEATRKALGSLQRREDNPTYEVLTAYGAQAAAYCNAQFGDKWDDRRMVNWCFDPTSPNRVGWGMIVGNWGGYDAGGLMGSVSDGGGYAFAMNTFLNMATLAPVARYDDRLSTGLAKWILNAANASRLYYKDTLPADHQSGKDWPGDPGAGIAYEAVRKTWEGKSPFAAGDAKRSGWAKEDFGLYGGGYVGLLAALVHPTNVPQILRIDLRATDFMAGKGYPTDLYWNPFDVAKTVTVDLGHVPVRLYDPLQRRFLTTRPKSGFFKFELKPKQSAQLVKVPAKGALVYDQNRTLIDGVSIDFNNGRLPLPTFPRRPRTDLSKSVDVSRAKDGVVDWAKSSPISMDGGQGSAMRAELKFGWDDRYLYFRVDQKAKATQTIEAPNPAELAKHFWDFEQIALNFDPSRETFAEVSQPEVTFGWSSQGKTDLVYSQQLDPSGISVQTSGTAVNGDRTIVGRIEWKDLYQALGTHEPISSIVRPGEKIACQPLLTDGTFKRQAYIGGARYTRPSGFDANSRTLVLR